MRILVVNAGSSSLKVRVLEAEDRLAASVDLPPPDSPDVGAALEAAVRGFGAIDAVGHRVVHGGTKFTDPVVVDDAVRRELAALTDLAPLHQPKALAGLDAAMAVIPDVPHVASFDTAFHATIPAAAATYALPGEWRARWPIRRFGFHGLSHAYASRRTRDLWTPTGAALPTPFRLVTCHLGAGASLAAVVDGRSVDTTMGFTPLEGLVMATRSGTVDPGLVLWLQTHGGLSAEDVETGLDRHSGLVGLAGSADMRDVVSAVERGDSPDAALALDVYVHRLVGLVAAMASAAGGIDALAFTGGVGEHAALVRSRAAGRLGFLGIAVSPAANEAAGPTDRELTAPEATVRTFVLEAREDLEIARQVREVVGRAG
jgi:acetate kinase